MDAKQLRVKIFEGTKQIIENSDRLKAAVETSKQEQKLYWEGETIEYGAPRFALPARIVLSHKKTVEAARPYAQQGKRVCILNFASSVAPGGGVTTGEQAQEESICRVSTLYFALSDKETAGAFYDRHWELIRAGNMNRRNTDDIVYTPGVIAVRDDAADEVPLPEGAWYAMDVITCAAPDIRLVGDQTQYAPNAEELYREFVKRWCCILAAAAKHEADVLILGAFGCGVFANPPELVARAFRDALQGFEQHFETIEFAIFSGRGDSPNYRAFSDCFCDAEKSGADK